MPYGNSQGVFTPDQGALSGVGQQAPPPGSTVRPLATTTAPSFNQTVTTDQASSNPQQQLAGQLYGQAGLSIADSNLTMEQLLQQIGLTVPNVAENAASQSLNLQYGLENAGIGQEQNVLSQQDVTAQQGLLSTQTGLEAQQYGVQSTQYPEQQAEAALQYANSKQSLTDSLAASGTLNTEGSKSQQSTLGQQYAWQQQDISRQQQLAGIGQQGTVAQEQYDAGSLARQQQNLQLTAQANGISVEQLLAQWQQGMQQLGVNADPSQLYNQYLTQQGSSVQTLGGVLGQGALLGGVGGVGTLLGGTG